MSASAATREELIVACKQAGVRGYSGKRKEEIAALLAAAAEPAAAPAAEQDTGKFRSNLADKFYTKPAVARKCVDRILERVAGVRGWQWIEPSAGGGAFLQSAAAAGVVVMGMDIDPKGEGIVQGDFLKWRPIGGGAGAGAGAVALEKRLVFGNPPFGRQGSLAKSFVQHASGFADAIAFVLPRSFLKPSMSRAFPLRFHCIWSEEAEKDAFEVNGAVYDVPCVFQIWVKQGTERDVAEAEGAEGFAYVKAGEAFDIAFRRVGVYAGRSFVPKEIVVDLGGRQVALQEMKAYIGTNGKPDAFEFSPQSHYFLRLDEGNKTKRDALVAAVNAVEFPSNTVGPRSVSKGEANAVLNRLLREIV
jgi:hypothetical protein